jgi:hypothetical protein
MPRTLTVSFANLTCRFGDRFVLLDLADSPAAVLSHGSPPAIPPLAAAHRERRHVGLA